MHLTGLWARPTSQSDELTRLQLTWQEQEPEQPQRPEPEQPQRQEPGQPREPEPERRPERQPQEQQPLPSSRKRSGRAQRRERSEQVWFSSNDYPRN